MAAVSCNNFEGSDIGKTKNWRKVGYLPVASTFTNMHQHEGLRHLTSVQIKERYFHACLEQMFSKSTQYCVQGVPSRDNNNQVCWAHAVLVQWVADLQECKLLLSTPAQVSHLSQSSLCSVQPGLEK